jgi:uncharacterized membrane protein
MNTSGMQLLQNFQTYIIDPAIILIFTAGFLVFIWGLTQFMWNLKDGSGHEEGVQHMLWGIVGMFIMVSVLGIIAIITDFVGSDARAPDTSRINNVQVPSFDI